MFRDRQLRLIYSLLKPALRGAARFGVPVRTMLELVRLGYFEVLSRRGLDSASIARVFGQTPRHMRSLSARLKTDFFSAETEIGLVRDIEERVAQKKLSAAELHKALKPADPQDIDAAIERLLREERIVPAENGRFALGTRYNVMASDGFVQRIDALNHHLDGLYRATVQRLVYDERRTAMIKTITISALPEELEAFLKDLEGDIRRRLAELEESAAFAGRTDQRFTFGLSVAAVDDAEDVVVTAPSNAHASRKGDS